MVDLSDPAVKKAYEDVRDDSTETSWAWFRYHPSKTALQVHATGAGSWDSFLTPIDDTLPMYGFCRYNWEERARTKFIFVSFIGEKVPALKKARIGHDKATVTNFFKGSHITLEVDSVGDLVETEVIAKLRRSGGADYDGGGRTTGAAFGTFKAEAKKTFDKPADKPATPPTKTPAPEQKAAEPAPTHAQQPAQVVAEAVSAPAAEEEPVQTDAPAAEEAQEQQPSQQQADEGEWA